jgi:hypothetical protein
MVTSISFGHIDALIVSIMTVTEVKKKLFFFCSNNQFFPEPYDFGDNHYATKFDFLFHVTWFDKGLVITIPNGALPKS